MSKKDCLYAISQTDKLKLKIDKLELMLYKLKNTNTAQNEIKNIEKKYSDAYRWYQQKSINEQQKSKDIINQLGI